VIVVAIVALIALPLAVILPVRITVTVISSVDYSQIVEIFIDDELKCHLEINQTRDHVSYPVSVGQHEVIVQHGWTIEFQDFVMAYPIVGASVECTL